MWTKTALSRDFSENMTEKHLIQLSCSEFSERLASASPTPGGGGASALVAALGASLGSMVGALTAGKPKYADVEPEILSLLERAEALRSALLACVDEDAAAFAPLAKAYTIPKDDPNRGEIMEQCLRDAAAVPMKILRLCCEGIELHQEFAAKGSRLAISDAATGVVFCWSAMYGAAVNVKVNTKLMRDTQYADAVNREVDRLTEQYWPIAERVYEDVYRRFC